MTPTPRTPQQRDRRFARIRRLSQALLLGSGVASALTITFIASAAKPYVAVPVNAPRSTSNASSGSSTAPGTTVPSNASGTPATTPPATPSTTQYTPPTTVPVTTTTACFTTPSGQVTCY